MYMVVAFPPEPVQTAVDAFRRLHDPAFHRVPAHLALIPPFEAPEQGLWKRFDQFHGPPPFSARLGAPRAEGRSLILPVELGTDHLSALRSSIADAVLQPHTTRENGATGLRIGLFSSEPELELGRRTLSRLPTIPVFEIAFVSLLLEDVRGIWHEIRRRGL